MNESDYYWSHRQRDAYKIMFNSVHGANTYNKENEDMTNPEKIYIHTGRANGKSYKVAEEIVKTVLKNSATSCFRITKVIFNEPATIVFWADGTKTVVKCQEWDEFDPEKGLAMAVTKKVYGNVGHYYEEIKKWVDPWYDKQLEAETVVSDFSFGLAKAAEAIGKLSDACRISGPVDSAIGSDVDCQA